jgi:pyruvate dehydrogenase E2 component (dihydrolipoamide acetyltransferase)
MPAEVIMPALGMAQDTGKVIRWLKAEGDAVVKGEPLLEIETDKVTVEIEAPAAGTLAAVSAAEGEDVPVGKAIAVVLAAGEIGAGLAAAPRAATTAVTAAAAPASAPPTVDGARPGRRLASPKARRLARERGVDLEALGGSGSGPGGVIVAADIERGVSVPKPSTPEPVGSTWRLMAERTTASWQTTPHFYLRRAVDASRLQSWRNEVRKRPGGEAVTHTDLLVKVVAEALRRNPRTNSAWCDGTIVPGAGIHVAIAVATDAGLVVPVIHDADTLDLDAIATRRREIVAAAREGRLRPDDVSGGTFTISNLGMYGVDSFDAIVNAPQAAILAVGRIADRVVPIDGQPAVRPVLELSVSFDHRVVDGSRGAEFLDTLASLVEEPAGLVR